MLSWTTMSCANAIGTDVGLAT